MEPMNHEQQMGFIISKLEELSEDVRSLTAKHEVLEKQVSEKFQTAEAVLRTLKFLGAAVVALLTFHFGDLPRLWSSFFGH